MRSFLTACSLFMIWLALVVKIENVSANLDYPWMYYLQYGNNVTLKPLFKNETEVILIKTCKWTSPKGIEIIPDVYNPDPNRYSINKYDCQLRITNIQADTNGIYHCNINDKYISKAMLNLHGAPGKTMAEELRPNIIAGLVTFFSVIAFFGFTCGIAKFKYQKPKETVAVAQDRKNAQVNATYEEECGVELPIKEQTRF